MYSYKAASFAQAIIYASQMQREATNNIENAYQMVENIKFEDLALDFGASGDIAILEQQILNIQTEVSNIVTTIAGIRASIEAGDSNAASEISKYITNEALYLEKNDPNFQFRSEYLDSDKISELKANTNLSEIDNEYLAALILSNENYEYKGIETHSLGKNLNGEEVKISVYVIYDAETGTTINVDINYDSDDIISSILGDTKKLDSNLISNLDNITITNESNPANEYWQSTGRPGTVSTSGGFKSKSEFFESKQTEVTFYGEYKEDKSIYERGYGDSSYIFAHEAAHAYDYGNGHISDDREWKEAMEKDGNYASQYAKDSYSQRSYGSNDEDFAEAVACLNTYGTAYVEKYFPNRTEILKKRFPEAWENDDE